MQISVTFDRRSLEQDLGKFVAKLAQDTFKAARDVTPVKTGRARSAWTKQTARDNFVVQNKVPYIERLEAGASRQAPTGIIGPTLNTIKGKYK